VRSSTKRTALLGASGLVAGALVTIGLVYLAIEIVGGDLPVEALEAPEFVEEAASAGIEHRYEGEFEYFVGGGVAAFDCDADRQPDLFLAGGTEPAALYRNTSPIGGELRFSKVTGPETAITGVTGAYPIDVDSDGIIDLAVLRSGENVMLRGLGQCGFERANELWGIDGGDDWTVAFSATWEEGASLPTLAFGNYLRLSEDGIRADGCEEHYLFRPEGEVYAEDVPLRPGWCTLSILFSDWSDSGKRDLRMTNDRHYYIDGEEQLWEIEAGELPRMYGDEDGWKTLKIWGMGIASQDITGDGLPEVYLTSQGDNKLQTLTADADGPEYEDVALVRGANAHRPFIGDVSRPSTAWHAEFDDVNNDGLMDLFVTKGNVEAMPEFAVEDPNNLLLGQPDGAFVESAATAGLLDYSKSRGAVVSDLNLDGLLDIVVVERREPVKVWRNTGRSRVGESLPMGNWVAISVSQPAPNVDAIGSWLEVRSGDRIVRRETTVGGGHAGGELGWFHFGLGKRTRAEARVEWPDGEQGPWIEIDVNRFSLIERGSSSAKVWEPMPETESP
jgi:hypothetical protein